MTAGEDLLDHGQEFVRQLRMLRCQVEKWDIHARHRRRIQPQAVPPGKHASNNAVAKVASDLILDRMPDHEPPLAIPDVGKDESSETRHEHDRGYLVICWDDPVNLMDYVTHVFQKVFGWPREKAEHHMLEVHHHGKSVLIQEGLERAEHYVHALQRYSLHASMEKAS